MRSRPCSTGHRNCARRTRSAIDPRRAGGEGANVRGVDEGLPIAYEVLEDGVPVYGPDGQQLGTVEHVVAAPKEDIFHGIVMATASGPRFVAADQVASLHEHGVDLRIDAAAVATLPAPHGGAPAWQVHEPGVKTGRWTHFVDIMSGKAHGENWTEKN